MPKQPTAQQTAVQTTLSAAIMTQQPSMDLVSTSASTTSMSDSLADRAITDLLHADLMAPASGLQESSAQTVLQERQQPQQAAVQAARHAPTRVSSAVQTSSHVPSPEDAADRQPGFGARTFSPGPSSSPYNDQGASAPARHAGRREKAIQAAEQVIITCEIVQQHPCM